jgi:hypothetical protein
MVSSATGRRCRTKNVPGTACRFTVETVAVKAPATVSLGLRVLLLVAAVVAPACQRQIGDECRTSVDCDPNGTRVCDLSQPGGYCTVMGCNETSCPGGSACIRYFPEQFLTRHCNPKCENFACQVDPCPAGETDSDGGTCLPPCKNPDTGVDCSGYQNGCTADEVCLDAGFCARRALEQRACAKTCGSNGDCRSGYQCRPAGTMGSMLLATDPNATASFCAPNPPQ